MCLAIPGKIISFVKGDELLRMAKVQFGSIVKEVSLAYVPEAELGDYVIVHVGFALSKLDEQEALKTLSYFKELESLEMAE